jgi:hypothetical protein
MGRCIVVLGIPRSGTSCVARVLHNLGVDMGNGYLQAGNESNARGYFEDLRWQAINKMITGEHYNLDDNPTEQAMVRYLNLAIECDRKGLWGMKDPRLCLTLKYVRRFLPEYGIVVVRRNNKSAIGSLVRHSTINYDGRYKLSWEQAQAIQQKWEAAMFDRLAEDAGIPTKAIGYEHLLHDPLAVVGELAKFCFEGLSTAPNVEAAVRLVDRRLKHH